MNNRPTQRGQVVQVGAIVVFGFVVLAIVIFQSQAVPQETTETELEHNQEVADQLETLSVALAETTATGTPQTTQLRLGTRYDGRPFFIYPPPTAGTLETTEPATVAIENAVNNSGPFDNYWSNETRTYNTSSIQYHIDYWELRETPRYTFEYGIAAATFENTTQVRSPLDRPLVDGTEISLVVYDGELAEQSASSKTVVTERVTNSTTVDITDDGGPITLQLPTELDEETWNETLDPDNQPTIDAWSHSSGTVSIELEQGNEYELTVHKVDVGPNATSPVPTYLRELERNSTEITVDVRDSYNDDVDETVGAWVFANETSTPEETLQIPPDGVTYDAADIDKPCLTIEKDIENAAAYETLDIGEPGGCP